MLSISTTTRRCFDVDVTLFTHHQCCINVEMISCAYWEKVFILNPFHLFHFKVFIYAFNISLCYRCTFVNYLARHGTQVNSNLTSALLLGVPWDPMEAKRRLSEFWNNLIINKHITKSLIDQVKRLKVFCRNVAFHLELTSPRTALHSSTELTYLSFFVSIHKLLNILKHLPTYMSNR